MMNGGDLYELAKILGHSNIKMTERYAKLARQHIARTGSTAREMWKLLEQPKLLEQGTCDTANILSDVRV
jgi:site-specific recombinase XerD